MKFNKLLKSGVAGEDDPQQQDGSASLYVRYGALKKQLKVMAHVLNHDNEGSQTSHADAAADLTAAAARLQSGAAAETSSASDAQRDLTAEEAAFVSMLNEDLAKFNAFFIDAEEDAIIQLSFLQEQLVAAKSLRETAAAKAAFVHFHGELILLLHWSTLNYAGLVKILKKHDKLNRNHILRAPYLANALHQPFYSTSCIEGLISEVEAALQPLSAPSAGGAAAAAAPSLPAAAAAASADAAAAPPADAASPRSGGGAAAGEATASTAASNSAAAADVPGSPAQMWQPVVAALAAPSAVHSPSRSRSQTDILKRTRVAMALWAELGEKAHTPSTVLPPSASPPKRQRVEQALGVTN